MKSIVRAWLRVERDQHRRRQAGDEARELLDYAESRLVARSRQAGSHRLEAHRGVLGRDGYHDADGAESVGCAGVAGVAFPEVHRHAHAERLTRSAHPIVVEAERAADGRHEEVVDAAAERVRCGLRGGERVGTDLEASPHRPRSKEAGPPATGDQHLAADGGGQSGGFATDGGDLGRVGGEMGAARERATDERGASGGRVGDGVECDVERRASGQRVRRGLRAMLGPELGAQLLRCDDADRRIGLEVDGVHGEAQAAHPVGDSVMHLLEQCGAPLGETLHERELPERPRSVEGRLGERGGEIEELAHPSGRRRGDVAEVVVDVECRFVDPLGWSDP